MGGRVGKGGGMSGLIDGYPVDGWMGGWVDGRISSWADWLAGRLVGLQVDGGLA